MMVKTGLEVRPTNSPRFAQVLLDEKSATILSSQTFVGGWNPAIRMSLTIRGCRSHRCGMGKGLFQYGEDTLTGSGIVVGVMDPGCQMQTNATV